MKFFALDAMNNHQKCIFGETVTKLSKRNMCIMTNKNFVKFCSKIDSCNILVEYANIFKQFLATRDC